MTGTAYPVTCENGTFTYDNMTNLQSQADCQPCVAGYFCRYVSIYFQLIL